MPTEVFDEVWKTGPAEACDREPSARDGGQTGSLTDVADEVPVLAQQLE